MAEDADLEIDDLDDLEDIDDEIDDADGDGDADGEDPGDVGEVGEVGAGRFDGDGDADGDVEDAIFDVDDGLDDSEEISESKADWHRSAKRTVNYVTKYEMAALIGLRAQQIAEGAKPLVEIGKLTDASSIALLELESGRCPLMIERPLPTDKIGKFKYESRNLESLYLIHKM